MKWNVFIWGFSVQEREGGRERERCRDSSPLCWLRGCALKVIIYSEPTKIKEEKIQTTPRWKVFAAHFDLHAAAATAAAFRPLTIQGSTIKKKEILYLFHDRVKKSEGAKKKESGGWRWKVKWKDTEKYAVISTLLPMEKFESSKWDGGS